MVMNIGGEWTYKTQTTVGLSLVAVEVLIVAFVCILLSLEYRC